MTDRKQMEYNYEDALFALWMDDLARSRGEKLIEENERLQADPSAVGGSAEESGAYFP